MQISMMTYTMARGLQKDEQFDAKGLCEFCHELDIDVIDWVSTYHYDAAQLRTITDDYGLKNVVHTFSADFNFATAEERKPAAETFKQGIEAAVTLGADIVMLPVSGKEEFSRDEARDNYLTGLEQAIGFADDAGVTVTVENFPHYLSPFITSADVNAAVARIPQLRVTFDNGNVTTGGETAAEGFNNSAQYIVHAHFKDWKICSPDEPGARVFLDGQYRRAVLVGDGDVDQLGGLKAMADYGYDGCINFEYEGSELTPREATIEGVRRMREWMAQVE
jgi:sugar phosphate isomerase/epimerase